VTLNKTGPNHHAMAETQSKAAKKPFSRYVVPLVQAGEAGINVVGSKAANLGELMRAGFPVPDGFVLANGAFDEFLKINGLDIADHPSIAEKALQGARMPEDVKLALAEITRTMDAVLAVRSSAPSEDLTASSFAGQYETVLGVEGLAELERAVIRCWVSHFGVRVAAYRATREDVARSRGGMAVIVQRMVNADAAGVAFSWNPVTADQDEVVVNAVRGLGDRLVSGHASPDEWGVRGVNAVCNRDPEKAITGEQAVAVANLAREAERHFGVPQDIEWAMVKEQLFLLQSRPITTSLEREQQIPIAIEVPSGFWYKETSHWTQPPTPASVSVVYPAISGALRKLALEYGLPLETIDCREIGGWSYSRIVPLGGKDRKAPPPPIMRLLVRTVPSLRKPVRKMTEAMQKDKFLLALKTWKEESKPKAIKRNSEFRSADLTSLSDEELRQELSVAVEWANEAFVMHFASSTPQYFTFADLAFTCDELLGWKESRVIDLLTGVSDEPSESSRRMGGLAKIVSTGGTSSKLEDIFKRYEDDGDGEDLIEDLKLTDPALAHAFTDYLNEFGHRALTVELAEQTMAERPRLFLRLVLDMSERGYDHSSEAAILAKRREESVEEARKIILSGSASKEKQQENLRRFVNALRRAQQSYSAREESLTHAAFPALGAVRERFLEAGRRLAKRGLIASPDDVFYLKVDEVEESLAKESGNARDTITTRKGQRAWARSHPGPASYGPLPPPPPPFDVFPREAAKGYRYTFYTIERTLSPQGLKDQGDSDAIKGLGASAGQYTGRVRVIRGEHEFSKLQPGEVLVCVTTHPDWSVLFGNAGALVVDSGGILSHPSIIAREFGLPAVVATGNATSLLKDGDLVSVDGSAGTVRRTS
jgi:phosphohistidine swiveling domain-containing protein